MGIRTNLMNPIWAVGLVTLSRSMKGATGRPSHFSLSLWRWSHRHIDTHTPPGLVSRCPSPPRKVGQLSCSLKCVWAAPFSRRAFVEIVCVCCCECREHCIFSHDIICGQLYGSRGGSVQLGVGGPCRWDELQPDSGWPACYICMWGWSLLTAPSPSPMINVNGACLQGGSGWYWRLWMYGAGHYRCSEMMVWLGWGVMKCWLVVWSDSDVYLFRPPAQWGLFVAVNISRRKAAMYYDIFSDHRKRDCWISVSESCSVVSLAVFSLFWCAQFVADKLFNLKVVGCPHPF